MSQQRFETILEKIAYVESNKKEFKNPELIIAGLNTLLANLD